jgi:hypothetical protein
MKSTGMHQKVTQLLMKLWKLVTGEGPDKLEAAALIEAASLQQTVDVKLLRAGTRNKHIELVQLALSQVTDLRGCARGKWDQATAAAYASFQRTVGYTGQDANGLPDLNSLKRLSTDTGLFTV